MDAQKYTSGLEIASTLLRELKKIDDKALLVEVCVCVCVCVYVQQLNMCLQLQKLCSSIFHSQVQLLESRAYQKLGNVTKSRASLTSAKTTANGIYCPPKLQASLDLQSGIGHVTKYCVIFLSNYTNLYYY